MFHLKISKIPLREWLGSLLSILIGIVVWVSTRVLTGENDPQSHVDYWRIGYPILVFASLVMSYPFNVRPWRWGAYMIATQLILGLLTLKGEPNLLPLGVLFHLILVVPCIAMGYLGAWLSRKISRRDTR